MTPTQRKTLVRMRELVAQTATSSALSVQVPACDPMPPPATDKPDGG